MQGETKICSEQLVIIAYQVVSQGQCGIAGRFYFLEDGHVIDATCTKSYPYNVNVVFRYSPKRIEGIGCKGFYVRTVENIPISNTERDGFAKISLANIIAC
jgi:hypothetical protein